MSGINMKRYEKLVYRLAFAAFGVFLGLGAWLMADPSDALTLVFGISFLVTLVIGVLSGFVAIYAS